MRDQLATTTIEQVFRNPNSRRVEGTFLFPVPKGAHLDRFSMEIDGEQVEAELLSAAKARKIYNDIVRKARDPALLEYDGQDLFKVRIFPIEANGKKRIRIRYSQLLKQDGGLVSYRLPLNTTRFSSRAIETLSVKIELEASDPLNSIYSPTHDLEITRDGSRHATIGYEASDVRSDTDLALHFSTESDEVGISILAHRVAGEDGYFVLLASPGMSAGKQRLVAKDVAFVLDTSGSMAGNKLEQAKKALLFCVENLNDGDRFEIIRFSTEAEPLFEEFTDVDRSSREKARDFVQGLKAIGGTAIDEALRRALALRLEGEDRPFVVIFLTDGLPTVGVTSEVKILANVKKRADDQVRVFCFGIGTDVNTHLLDKITEETRATSQYVLPTEDLELKLSRFFTKINEPVLANPTIRFDGDIRVFHRHPSDLPDLFRGEQLVLTGRYEGSGALKVILGGAVNGKTRKFSRTVRFPRRTEDHEFVPRLWASRRVGYLLDQIRLHGENRELKDEVTKLAREYGLVTPYTAYLILEDEEHRRVPATVQSMPQLRHDRTAHDAVRSLGRTYGTEHSGGVAVSDARSTLRFRQAESLSGISAGRKEAQRVYSYLPSAGGAATMTPQLLKTLQVQTQSAFVGGKNFFWNGNRWVDSQVQHFPDAQRIQLEFGSVEYFSFASTNRQALPWLAQGSNVEFMLNGTIYEISE